MAEILLDEQSPPATPANGKGIAFPDSTVSRWACKNDAGRCQLLGPHHNSSIASQGAGFSSDTYVTDSDIQIPSWGLQARSVIRWTISVSKTAAGTAAPAYNVRIGANRTTADTARLTLNGPAQTAAADVAVIEIMLVVQSVGASGVIRGTLSMKHNGAAVGFANNDGSVVEGAGAGFDNSALAGQFIGLSINGGTSAAWTVTQVRVEASW